MLKKVDCPDCGGTGELEDRKGNLYTCRYCKGKGTILENVDDEKEETSTNS